MISNKKFLKHLASIILAIILLEALIRTALALINLNDSDKPLPYTLDRAVKYRPNPNYPGHDKNGYRNEQILKKASIVTLGDSQTYGAEVQNDKTWPQQLSKLSGQSIYNMSFGGYSLANYTLQLNDALKLKPSTIIIGIYSGNDLYDSYSLIYKNNQFSELKTNNPDIISEINKLELDNNSEEYIKKHQKYYTYAPSLRDNNHFQHIRSFLSKYSKTYTTVGEIKNKIFENNKNSLADKVAWAKSNNIDYFKHKQIQTIFQSPYRLYATDLTDPRISEGLDISIKLLNRVKNSSGKTKIILLFIPTKEFAFSNIITNTKAKISEQYQSLIRNETEIWKRLGEHAAKNNIEYINPTKEFFDLIDKGINPYLPEMNGHINEAGHKAIAHLINIHLESKNEMGSL